MTTGRASASRIFAAMILLAGLWSAVAAPTAGAAEATDGRPARWSRVVKTDGRQFQIVAVSKSGDALEDDMTVTILQEDEKVPVPVRPALYEAVKVSSDLQSSAEGLPVFKIGPARLLFILTENARPGYPYATLVVYDYHARKVTEVRERIAPFKQESQHSRYAFVSFGPDRYRIRLIRESLDIGSDGPEAFIEGWMIISYGGGRLEYAWQ